MRKESEFSRFVSFVLVGEVRIVQNCISDANEVDLGPSARSLPSRAVAWKVADCFDET